MKDIPTLFGSMVFNDMVMQARLPVNSPENKTWYNDSVPDKKRVAMKHIFCLTFVLLLFVSVLAAQERTTTSTMMMGLQFRGKTIQYVHKAYSDGTATHDYHDISGNPLPETERNFVDGFMKLQKTNTYGEYGITSEVNATSSLLIHVFGDNPEFRGFTGITLEQVRDIYLAQWDMLGDFPSDEMLAFCINAAKTDEPEELERISAEYVSYFDEEFKKIDQSVTEILSPVQIQKLWELGWAMRPKVDFDSDSNVNNSNPIKFAMYNALTLDAEQQKRLKILKTEYVQARLEIHRSSLSGKKKWDKNKELAESMRDKLKGMLTAAQRAKLEQIWGNKPKFMTAAAPTPPKKPEDYEWMKSWRPGDPIPEGMLPPPPPPSRFPRL